MEFISNVVELISAFRAETRQDAITPDSLGSLLLRMINALRYAWSSSTHPFYHIQCDTKDGRLIVKHPKKKPRYRDIEDRHTRSYGPVMRGWHLFYDEKKLQMAPNGVVAIGKNVGTDKNPEWVYEENCRNLFGNIREVTEEGGIIFKVGFGSRIYHIKSNHRFRFGVVFGPPLPEKGNRSLKFAECVTNIAEFYVNFHKRSVREEGDQGYKISYSI